MATATPQHAGGYNSLSMFVREQIWNPTEAEDTIFGAIPLLNFFRAMDGGRGDIIQKRKLGRDLVVKIIDEEAQGTEAYEYYDTLSKLPSKLGAAARFGVSNYQTPLTMSEQEEDEFDSDEAFADAIEQYIELVYRTQTTVLNKDLYGGNALDSKKILGLEQICLGTSAGHDDKTGTTATNVNQPIKYGAQVRKATDIYGGIQRAAWTISSGVITPGTGWESNVYEYGPLTTTDGTIGFDSNGIPSEGYKRMLEMYTRACSVGNLRPNFIVMSPEPYQDYELACLQKTQFQRRPGSFENNELASDDYPSFKKAVIIEDENAVSSRTVNNQTIGDDNIYFGNTAALKLRVDSRKDHILKPPQQAADQLASTMRMIWRGQLICTNPRLIGRMSGYTG